MAEPGRSVAVSLSAQMFSSSQSQLSFESGGKNIRLDCFLPTNNGRGLPAVIGLHGSGGGHGSMAEPATLLAGQGFQSTCSITSIAPTRSLPMVCKQSPGIILRG